MTSPRRRNPKTLILSALFNPHVSNFGQQKPRRKKHIDILFCWPYNQVTEIERKFDMKSGGIL